MSTLLHPYPCGGCGQPVDHDGENWRDATGSTTCAVPMVDCPGCAQGTAHPHFPVIMSCAVCARVLRGVQTDDPEDPAGWDHEEADQPADHPAVPVRASEIDTALRCDFCGVDGPGWVIPARTFTMPESGLAPGEGGARSLGDWSACETCAGLIARRQWRGLLNHGLRIYQQKFRLSPAAAERVAESMDRMFRRLRQNITGPPRPAVPREVGAGHHHVP